MTHTPTALIIGGGIAGPAAAMALQKAGIDSVIYEAHPSGAEGIGVFLTLGSNGIDALRTIGADTAALAAGFPTPGIMMRSAHTGKQLGVSRISTSRPDGTPATRSSGPTCTRRCTTRRPPVASPSSTASGW